MDRHGLFDFPSLPHIFHTFPTNTRWTDSENTEGATWVQKPTACFVVGLLWQEEGHYSTKEGDVTSKFAMKHAQQIFDLRIKDSDLINSVIESSGLGFVPAQ